MSVPDETVWLQELTWQDFESYVETEDHPTVIVPIGSTEQHGPHLPLGVDAYQAKDMAEEIAARTGVLAAPPIWYGDADHHLAFPGTVSLSSETVVAVLTDIYESLLSHGVENILTVNGHRMANNAAIEIAADNVKDDHPEAFFATIDLVLFGVRIYREMREGDKEAGFHGGEFETSFIMHKHPDLVKEDEFVASAAGGWTRFTSNDYVNLDDKVMTAKSRHDWPEDALGHQGDPTKASAEKGEELIERLCDNAEEFLDDLRAFRTAQQSDDGGSLGLSY
ncbi:creatininase family protein [Halorarius litoreus]|uniref:creatininase family protein n=1 Tax=Halorarius litoreus TaxID=2962676 RepID=UPI0020CF1449|nr:creatininase family protein [Halorarius litoreus]